MSNLSVSHCGRRYRVPAGATREATPRSETTDRPGPVSDGFASVRHLGDARDASMFPETLETDRLWLERYCHDTATPREVYDAFGRPSPTVEAETEFLPWDLLDTVGAAADRLDRFE